MSPLDTIATPNRTEVSPLQKLVGRGDTTVVDAYLSPILRRHVEEISRAVGAAG